MKLFVKLFFSIFIFEIILGMISSIVHQELNLKILNYTLNTIMTILSFPICLIDWSYPFYAVGSNLFLIFLIFSNILIQTIFIYYIISFVNTKT